MVIATLRLFHTLLICLRRLLVFPKGNGTLGSGHHIEVYLDFLDALFTPPQLCPKVKFQIKSMTSTDFLKTRRTEATHSFTSQNRDWGFGNFLLIQEALNPRSGHLVDDSLTLSVEIHFENNSILGMMSKAETGFVGIKGHARTSLFSAFLLCLFHIKAFRKTVYQMQILESDDRRKSVPLALQHLFYKLQYQNTSVETEDLVKALHWDFDPWFVHYDVFRMQRVLFGRVAEQYRTRREQDGISDLFIGEYSNYNDSPTISEAQTSKQSYTEIPLNVLECKDIYASLEKLCQIGRLKEDNHDRTVYQGLHESKHHRLFDSFPTILQFNLEQYNYNPQREAILIVIHPFCFRM